MNTLLMILMVLIAWVEVTAFLGWMAWMAHRAVRGLEASARREDIVSLRDEVKRNNQLLTAQTAEIHALVKALGGETVETAIEEKLKQRTALPPGSRITLVG